MKPFPFLLVLALISSSSPASEHELTAVRRADESRIQATITRDAAALGELLSDDLSYAHADGRVQSKAQLIAALANRSVTHLSVASEEVNVHAIAQGAAALNGLTRVVVESSGQRVSFALRFLSVWRLESGRWRLVAYQSAQLSPPSTAK